MLDVQRDVVELLRGERSAWASKQEQVGLLQLLRSQFFLVDNALFKLIKNEREVLPCTLL